MEENIQPLPRVPKGRRAEFHGEAGVDQLFGIVSALAAELWAARERIDTLERLLERGGTLPARAVESFAPGPEAQAARAAERDAFIERVFQVLERYA